MRVQLQHTHIFASDIEATLRFWQDMFGAQTLFDTGIAGSRQHTLGDIPGSPRESPSRVTG